MQDISHAPEVEDRFLKACYCSSGALSQYALVSKQILQARYSSLFQKEIQAPNLTPVMTKSGLSKELTADVLAATLKRRPIILLGDVGVGKSIFIRHLIKVDASDLLNEKKALVLYIDFGKEPALAKDLEDFVMRRIKAELSSDHQIDIDDGNFVRGVYHGDILKFSKSIFGPLRETDPPSYQMQEIELLSSKIKDKAAHLKESLTHISKAQERQIVLFLDNIDQRPIDFQESVFLIGQGFAETWPMTVFISLRPDTFAHSKVKGSIAAYHPRVFTVAPPRVDLVIALRLAFALKELEQTGRMQSFPTGISLRQTTLSDYLSVLQYSFDKSAELTELIDNLSGGNIRVALEFLSDVVGSGHVDSQKILDIYHGTGEYLVPAHEFIRAVLYKDHEYYDPSASRIANIFDISAPDGKEHFLQPIILALVERVGRTGVNEGFVGINSVFDFCQGLGFQPAQIHVAVERAVSKKLLDSNPRFSADLSVIAVRITTIGLYTITKLLGTFTYVDAVVVDTPIVDSDLRVRIRAAGKLADRLDRADVFKQYLDQQWATFNGVSLPFDWSSVASDLQADMQKVRRRLEQIKR